MPSHHQLRHVTLYTILSPKLPVETLELRAANDGSAMDHLSIHCKLDAVVRPSFNMLEDCLPALCMVHAKAGQCYSG
jgi:hypothetical protein